MKQQTTSEWSKKKMLEFDKPTLYMLVGLPASGKSYYAKQLQLRSENVVIHSSDDLRNELFGCSDDKEVNSPANNQKVFTELHKRIKQSLKDGKNVVYDATNINRKRRIAFLNELKNISCYKKCIVVITNLYQVYKNNQNRDRIVPDEVIDKMLKTWNTPYYFEGWDDICLEYNSNKDQEVEKMLVDNIDYNQRNPHHKLSLGLHSFKVGCKAGYNNDDCDNLLKYAGFLHDLGKPLTQTIDNNNIAHYYGHENVSAYLSFFFKHPIDISSLDLSILINLHMMPFYWENCNVKIGDGWTLNLTSVEEEKKNEKLKNKYKALWGEQLFNNVVILHETDVASLS